MMYACLRPLLFQMSPEKAHQMALYALEKGIIPAQPEINDPALQTSLAGLQLPNPISLAAGFDKNACSVPHVFRQGFGFVEIGTVTPRAQTGNPKPRVFRLPQQEAIINRLGFNNDGLEAAIIQLQKPRHGIVGANIGKNKDSHDAIEDYVTGLKGVHPFADYVTVNISSPNTAGLRDLQHADALHHLLSALQEVRRSLPKRKPLFVKIAPDMEDAQLAAVIEAALLWGVDGLIIANTTLARPEGIPHESGGLSGKPLFVPSTEMLRRAYRMSEGNLALIGVGGIASAEDAYAKLQAGASALQLYTALVYQGFGLVTSIKRGLLALLKRDGFASVSDAIGSRA